VAGGEATNDHRDRLQPGVAGDGLDDRHERREQNHLGEGAVEVVDDEAGQHFDEQRGEDPRQAHEGDLARRPPLQLGGVRAREPEDVLRGLLVHDVEHVVDGDDADETVLDVDHRQHDEIVLRHDVRDLFPIHLGRDAHDVVDEDGPDGGVGIGDEQPPNWHHTDQMLVIVDDEELEGSLLDDGLVDVLEGPLDRGRLVDGHHVGGHQPAGRVLRVVEELLDVPGLLLLHQVEDFFGLLGRELFDDVGGVVGRHPIQDQRDLDLLQGLHELQERRVVHLGQDAGGLLRPQQTEYSYEIGERQMTEDPGQIGRMRLLDDQLIPDVAGPAADGSGRLEEALARRHAPAYTALRYNRSVAAALRPSTARYGSMTLR